jgi:hypothetical protein
MNNGCTEDQRTGACPVLVRSASKKASKKRNGREAEGIPLIAEKLRPVSLRGRRSLQGPSAKQMPREPKGPEKWSVPEKEDEWNRTRSADLSTELRSEVKP